MNANLERYGYSGPTNVNWQRVFGKDKTPSRGETYTISFITELLDKTNREFNDVRTRSQQDIQSLQQKTSQVRENNAARRFT